MLTHISFVIVNASSSSWSLISSGIPDWFITTRTQNNAAVCMFYRQVSRAEFKAPSIQCPFLSKWAVTPVKGKQCLLEHHTLFELLFHIKDKKMGHRLCLAIDILQMPVLVLWTALLSQEPDSDIHTWIGTIWWWPLPSTSAPPLRCFMLLFQPNCSKLHKFQMQHFYMHNHSLIIYFTVKALVWQMKIE